VSRESILEESIDLDMTEVHFDIDDAEWIATYDGREITVQSGDLHECRLGFTDQDKWLAVAKRMIRGLIWALDSRGLT
jgi:hypothetical protein